MATNVDAQLAAAPPTSPLPPRRRRRPRSKPLPVGGAERHGDGSSRRRSAMAPEAPVTEAVEAAAAVAPTPQAFPRLWALLLESQEEMERGTDALSDELGRLWRRLRTGDGCGGGGSGGRSKGGSGRGATVRAAAAVRREVGRGGTTGPGNALVDDAPAWSSRLPPETADALLAGLGRLQVDMEAEALSFQQRKADLVQKVEALGRRGARGGQGGREEKMRDEVVELEEEAENMRATVAAAHARLLGRVREVGGGLVKVLGLLLCPCFVAPDAAVMLTESVITMLCGRKARNVVALQYAYAACIAVFVTSPYSRPRTRSCENQTALFGIQDI